MLLRSLLCLLFLTSPLYGQYKLSDKKPDGTPLFIAGWETVHAPTKKIVQYDCQPGMRFHAWTLAAAGDYEIRNALVDKFHRAGAWSAIKTMTLPAGWQLWVNASNQPHDVRSCGVVWQVRKVGQPWEVFVDSSGGVQPHSFGSRIPTSQASSPRHYQINLGANLLLREGGECDIVAPAPDVYSYAVPNVELEVAYSWVTHNGETALSPVGVMPVSAHPAATAGCATVRTIRIGSFGEGGQKFPMGALGYYLYLRTVGGEWHRQPKRVAAANLDDFLWQPDDCKLQLTHYRDDTPGPSPAANPQSYLSDFQRMAMYTKGDCVIDRDVVYTYSPFVEEYEGREGVQTSTVTIPAKVATIPAGSTAVIINGVNVPLPSPAQTIEIEPAKIVTYTDPLKQPYVGSESVQKFPGSKGRKIRGTGVWTLQARGRLPAEAGAANTHPTHWPVAVTEGRGQWEDCTFKGDDTWRTSAGMCFRDYSGGQSFACGFYRCGFVVKNSDLDYRTQGMRVMWECEGYNGHTASELVFHDCIFSGNVPIWLEHNQTANVNFTGRTFAMNYQSHRLCPTLWLNLPLQVRFESLFTDNYGTIFSFGWMPQVEVGKIFVDQQFTSLCDTNNQQPGSLTIKGGQVNFRSPQAGLQNWLCRVANTTNKFPLSFSDFKYAEGASLASLPCPNKIAYTGERTNMTGMVTLVEPTAEQWTALGCNSAMIGTVPGLVIPGQTVTIAAKTVPVTINGETVPVPVPAQDIVIPDQVVNGLSTVPQVVARQAWLLP